MAKSVRTAGLEPTHLDFHSLADGGRDDTLDVAMALAVEHGLAVRVWPEPGQRMGADGTCPSSTFVVDASVVLHLASAGIEASCTTSSGSSSRRPTADRALIFI